MSIEFKTLDQSLKDGSLDRLVATVKDFFIEITKSGDLGLKNLNNEVLIVQALIGVIALVLIGIIFLPFGATPESIKACQLNTDQKLVKYGGVTLVIMTSLSAIFYLEIMHLNGILDKL